MQVEDARLDRLEAPERTRVAALRPDIKERLLQVIEARHRNTGFDTTSAARDLLHTAQAYRLSEDALLHIFTNSATLSTYPEGMVAAGHVPLAKTIEGYLREVDDVEDVDGKSLRSGDIVEASIAGQPAEVKVFAKVKKIYEDGRVIVEGPFGLGDILATSIKILNKKNLIPCFEEVGSAVNMGRLTAGYPHLLGGHTPLDLHLRLLEDTYDFAVRTSVRLGCGSHLAGNLRAKWEILELGIKRPNGIRKRKQVERPHRASDRAVREAINADKSAF